MQINQPGMISFVHEQATFSPLDNTGEHVAASMTLRYAHYSLRAVILSSVFIFILLQVLRGHVMAQASSLHLVLHQSL